MAQLRAGKCPVLADYRHACKWLDSSACACGAPSESVQHLVLNCPLHENERQRRMTPDTNGSLTVLSLEPARVMAFMRQIGREGCAAVKPTPTPTPAPAATPAKPSSSAGGGGGVPRRARQIPLNITSGHGAAVRLP